ncbi:uncharacterized protein ACA1_362130 [Acanthamoeba castellanii str. Neff]|uniref:Uncharacterized protein n=1 Tax=Acanthamoeba castellanii (strain ATCC 30010 / Neff) TaxID=1257118 RepID=L8GHT2_ACACF|nr:uncharacterized protein ACA1_362130 [Acanthamoeba castellanii str. Neff]ELR11751.1 hypothetical protein ACA1_362130 [Acanthamoeba castellanii str. Neff]
MTFMLLHDKAAINKDEWEDFFQHCNALHTDSWTKTPTYLNNLYAKSITITPLYLHNQVISYSILLHILKLISAEQHKQILAGNKYLISKKSMLQLCSWAVGCCAC